MPIFLGGDERLFDNLPPGADGFELVALVKGREAAHLTYSVKR